MQRHAREEEELNQINLKRFMMQESESKGCENSETARKRFKFSYIDIEKLVALNIKKRIRELVRESNTQRGNRLYVASEIDHETSSSSCDHSESQEEQDDDDEEDESLQQEEYDDDMKIEKIKPYLTEFANVVTFNWILKLIESEIKRRSKQNQIQNHFSSSTSSHHSASNRLRRFSFHHFGSSTSDEPETIFLVNLLPNRINLFKKCLYLNQTPNLNHAQFDYFAINLTRIESEKKKDLDVVSTGTSFLDETNNIFVKYFRSLGKLVEFRIKDDHYHNMNQSPNEKNGLTIKLSPKTDEKQAVIVRNVDQLKSLLRNHLHNLSINSEKGNLIDSGCSKSKKVLLVNVDQFRWESEEKMSVRNNENRNLGKSKSPPSPLIFMVENRIELEDQKVTVLVDDSFRDTNIVRPFLNCLRQVLQEMSEKGSQCMI